jgi:hypothetical protein
LAISFFFIHMYIQCLGHFSPLPPTPSLNHPTPPLSPATPLLPGRNYFALMSNSWPYLYYRLLSALSYLVTFSLLMEHFHMAPVTAANRSLLSVLFSRLARGLSPPCSLTRSRVSSSSAHYTKSKSEHMSDQGISSAQ